MGKLKVDPYAGIEPAADQNQACGEAHTDSFSIMQLIKDINT